MPIIGAHVSAAVSLDLAVDRALEIGASCMQFFVSPPRQWSKLEHSEKEVEEFKKKALKAQIGPNFIHGTYLISLGTKDKEHLEKSVDWLIFAMNMASKLGVKGVIFHLGSHKGEGFEAVLPQIVESIKRVLQNNSVELILENSAGAGANIGGNFRELGRILKLVQNDTGGIKNNRLKVCLDTQHAFATGYDLKTPLGLKATLAEFDKEIGLSNLAAIHANDSKTELKSGRDRHENIGDGFIGSDGFENMVNNPAFSNIPFILEVPGFSGNGPDKENIEILKSLQKIKN